jgi:hypothetical protein
MFHGASSTYSISDGADGWWTTTCTLDIRKNGVQIFNDSVTDKTSTYSGVIDMPAGRGHVTVTFSVSCRSSNKWNPSAWISDLVVMVVKKSSTGITLT